MRSLDDATEHVPVRVALHSVPRPERLRAAIRSDFDRLKSEYADLQNCRVAFEIVDGGLLPRFCAHLDLRLPQCQVIVSGQARDRARSRFGLHLASRGRSRAPRCGARPGSTTSPRS